MSLAYRKAGLKDDDQEAKARFCEIKDFGKSLTSQAHADAVDVNKLVAKIQKGQIVMTSSGTPFYGDVSELGGLQEAVMKVQESEELFMQLPADVREKFNNDPIEMIEYLEDSKNYDEAVKLGIVNKRPEITPVPEPEKKTPPVATGGV